MVDMFFDKILKLCYTQKMLLKNAENKQKQKLSKFILQMVMVSLAALIGGANFKNFLSQRELFQLEFLVLHLSSEMHWHLLG